MNESVAVNRVGALAIINIGIISEKSNFYNEQNIFPIGYKSIRTYWSTVTHNRTEYTCELLDENDSPVFKITPADDPERVIVCSTALGKKFINYFSRVANLFFVLECVSKLQERINEMRGGMNEQKVSLGRDALSGLHFFGLSEEWVTRVIEEHPDAAKCNGYKFKFSVPVIKQELTLPNAGNHRFHINLFKYT